MDYTNTFLVLKVLNLVASNGFLDLSYNFDLLYILVRVNSKFYGEFQPCLSCIEERLSEQLNEMVKR